MIDRIRTPVHALVADRLSVKMKNSKTSELNHRGHPPKLWDWKQNLSESHLGAELVRSEDKRLARLAPIALAPFLNRTHTGLPALPNTFASIATRIFQQNNSFVQTF